MIVVVGIGADGMAGLSPDSKSELQRATVVYGSRRQLALLDDTVTAARREWPTPMLPALQALLEGVDGDVHVVASGDPLLHGVGSSLIRLYGAERVTVLPHVSSVTLACSRLGWAVQEIEVISLVQGDPHTAVRRGGQAVVMSRDGATLRRWHACSPTPVAATPRSACSSNSAVLQSAAEPPPHATGRRDHGRRRRPQRGRGALPARRAATRGAARRDVRQRRPAHQATGAGGDAGGAGAAARSTAVGCRRRIGQRRDRMVSQRRRVSGDRLRTRRTTPQPHHRQRGRVRRAGGGAVRRARVVRVRPRARRGLRGRRPDAAGAAGGVLRPAAPGGRLVVNAVTVETEALVAQWYSQQGGELRRFEHHRGEPLGGFTGWRPAMPITQWAVTRR